VNDRNPSGGPDSVLVGWSTMLPSFTSPSQAVDRMVRLREAQRRSMSVKGTDFLRDDRDERLQRAGYLLVLCVAGLGRVAAALVRAIFRWVMKQAVALIQAVARQAS